MGPHSSAGKGTAARTQRPRVRIPLKPRNLFSGFFAISKIAIASVKVKSLSHLYFRSSHHTVNSRYCGHARDCDLVSVLARVRNSGVREKKKKKKMYLLDLR